MKPDDACIAFIKLHEGVKHTAYLDSVGIPTAGVGHTGPDVQLHHTYTDAQINAWLQNDLQGAASAVNDYVEMPLKQNQFNACVSLCFNIGNTAFGKSTLVRLLNDGDFDGAADQFRRWVKAGGVEIPGLVKRREDEKQLFLRDTP